MTAAAPQEHDPPHMMHTSFYMRSDVEARLRALLEDLHHENRRPIHEVLAAMTDVVEEHRSEIEIRLRRGTSRGHEVRKDGASR
jgi:hypothetical protein